MELKTVPISQLLDKKFNIPAYQRGYRWDNQQVCDLLDDLKRFSETKDTDGYYCLQPIVVKLGKDDVYDVIDGQQRLTTIFLLLSYLSTQRRYLHPKSYDKVFELKFDKRDDGYLNDKKYINDTSEYKNDINKFYIYKAYQAIEEWFKSQENLETTILFKLLGQQGNETTGITKVIWYDVSQSNDTSINIFTRLNYGKIPLTDAELIKALLMICDNFNEEEKSVRRETAVNMSAQWDEIENALHNDKLWGLISSSQHSTQSRISLIIDKVVRDIKNKDDETRKMELKEDFISNYDFSEDKEYFDYHIVAKYLELNHYTAASIDNLWRMIMDSYTVMRDWANDRVIYHYLGLLSYFEEAFEKDRRKKAKRVNALIDKYFKEYISGNYTKEGFRELLRKAIGDKIRVKNLMKLMYGSDDSALRYILLAFNVEQARKHDRDDAVFSFVRQRDFNATSLEHIHPQNLDSDYKNTQDDYEAKVLPWLNSKKRHLSGEEKQECEKYLDFEFFTHNFDSAKAFIEKIDNKFKDLVKLSDAEMHSIRNMALVSRKVNSALSNNFLAEKRSILNSYYSCSYIPIGTSMVFNKAFTDSPSNLTYWEKEDRDAYYKSLRYTYLAFTTKHIKESHFDDGMEAKFKIGDETKYCGFSWVIKYDGKHTLLNDACEEIPFDNGWITIRKKNGDKYESSAINELGEIKEIGN